MVRGNVTQWHRFLYLCRESSVLSFTSRLLYQPWSHLDAGIRYIQENGGRTHAKHTDQTRGVPNLLAKPRTLAALEWLPGDPLRGKPIRHSGADYRLGLTISQLIMSIAHGDTDERLLEEECGKLGVDWRDAILLRTQRAIENWEVLAFIKSL